MSLPPLQAIRVFEAAARHLSFTAAAEELGVTQAAVSHQVKLLEGRLGAPLFLRLPRGIRLTELGERLARPTRDAFALLTDAFAEGDTSVNTLTIATFSSVGANWLAQRIGRYQAEHPELAIRLQTGDRMTDFAREEVDVAIRHGRGSWPGQTAVKLFDMVFAPMMSPARAAEWGPFHDPAQIVPLPWLDNTDPIWTTWLTKSGVVMDEETCDTPARPTLGSQIHEARAAMAGEGIAMLTPRFFRFELGTGALVQPFPRAFGTGTACWLVYPEARRNRPAIRRLRQFLLAEAAGEADPDTETDTAPDTAAAPAEAARAR